MKIYFFPAIKITLLTLILFGVIYPLFIVGFAKLIGPNGGKGQTIEVNGKIIGFELIGQSFTSAKYFNSRPSAVSYNAAATGGSNKGSSNPEYLKTVEDRITAFLAKNPTIKKEQIPVDLITASGSGLDPHISVQAAMIQVGRIARVRSLDTKVVEDLVNKCKEGPVLGIFGVSRVHVLQLNIALDNLK